MTVKFLYFDDDNKDGGGDDGDGSSNSGSGGVSYRCGIHREDFKLYSI